MQFRTLTDVEVEVPDDLEALAQFWPSLEDWHALRFPNRSMMLIHRTDNVLIRLASQRLSLLTRARGIVLVCVRLPGAPWEVPYSGPLGSLDAFAASEGAWIARHRCYGAALRWGPVAGDVTFFAK